MNTSSLNNIGNAGALTQAYLVRFQHKVFLGGILVVALVIMAIFAVTHGSYHVSIRQVLAALLGSQGDTSQVVITQIRLPRVVSAIICGWALSLAGVGLQSLLKNALGSPFTLGLSQGASFGAAAAVVLFNAQLVTVAMSAFAGTLTSTLIILILAQVKKFSPEAIVLAGVAISAFFHSATILMQYMANETELAMVVFWTFGDVARSNWPQIWLLLFSTLATTIYFSTLSWDLNALNSGEEAALGLGVNVVRLRILGLVILTLIVALATAFNGVIAFLGLIAPHIAKRLVGDDHRLLIPFAGLVGALLLLLADTLGRLLIGSGSLPVGVITSFMGAPLFLYLLLKRYR